MFSRLTRSKPRRITVLLALNAAFIAVGLPMAGFLWPTSDRTIAPMLVVAHRGDVANEPENTIVAFLSAAELGADGIEMDIQRSESGTWWVLHDETVDRTANGHGAVDSLTDADLAELRITGGIGYQAERHGLRNGIPRLEEALDALAEYRGLIYVHLRHPDPAAFGEIAGLLRSRGLATRAAVIGSSVSHLEAVKGADPRIRTLLWHDAMGFPPDDPAVDAWLTSRHRIIRPDIVAWRPYDVEVFVDSRLTGADEVESIERAYRWNVAAFLSNNVAAARAAITRLDGGDG